MFTNYENLVNYFEKIEDIEKFLKHKNKNYDSEYLHNFIRQYSKNGLEPVSKIINNKIYELTNV